MGLHGLLLRENKLHPGNHKAFMILAKSRKGVFKKKIAGVFLDAVKVYFCGCCNICFVTLTVNFVLFINITMG